MEKHKVIYGDKTIEFELQRKSVKNINLKVKRDASVIITANKKVPHSYIIDFVKKKSPWILKNVEHFKQNLAEEIKSEFISGETIKYLGRQYRLKVVESKENSFKLLGGYLQMFVEDKNNYRMKEALYDNWLKERANKVFKGSLKKMHEKIQKYNIPFPQLSIRSMTSRWGSCLPYKNKITLNLQLIKAPKSCIDYVVLHELAHFKFRNHDKDFYNFLSVTMPDWRERKALLDEEYVRGL